MNDTTITLALLDELRSILPRNVAVLLKGRNTISPYIHTFSNFNCGFKFIPTRTTVTIMGDEIQVKLWAIRHRNHVVKYYSIEEPDSLTTLIDLVRNWHKATRIEHDRRFSSQTTSRLPT